MFGGVAAKGSVPIVADLRRVSLGAPRGAGRFWETTVGLKGPIGHEVCEGYVEFKLT